MIDFGMPTLIETKSLEECAVLCNELGLSFIELNMNLPEYQVENIDIPWFRAIAKKYGIYYTIHLDENLNVCDFNKKVAAAYLETVLQSIEIAKQLNIPVLNMHMARGVYFTLPTEKRYLFAENEALYLQALRDFRDKCEASIGDSNIKICIENSDGYNQPFLLHGLDLLLESPVFALTLDIGHNAGVECDDESVIMERTTKLCHMHIHDAVGRKSHLSLGDGELDLPKYFYMAKKYNCRAALETKTIDGLRKSVEWVKKCEVQI